MLFEPEIIGTFLFPAFQKPLVKNGQIVKILWEKLLMR